MYVLGIIGYTIICLLALTWLLGVRTQLDGGVHVILASLFFLISAVALPLSGSSLLHSWWMIPTGFAIGVFSGLFLTVPVIGPVFHIIASLYASIVRLGIDPRRVRAAQLASIYKLLR